MKKCDKNDSWLIENFISLLYTLYHNRCAVSVKFNQKNFDFIRGQVSGWLSENNYNSAYEAMADTRNENYATNITTLLTMYQAGAPQS